MTVQYQVPIFLTDSGVKYASENLHVGDLHAGQEMQVKVNVAIGITAIHASNRQRYVCLGRKRNEWTFPAGKVEHDEETLFNAHTTTTPIRLRESIPAEYKHDSDPRFTMNKSDMPKLTRYVLLGGVREFSEETSINLLDYDLQFRLMHRPEIFPASLEHDFVKYLSVVIFADLGELEELPGVSSEEFEAIEWVGMCRSGADGRALRASTKMWLEYIWEKY